MPPKVRPVRLIGEEDDARAVAELLALLPGLSQDRVQLGEISDPYPNRRGAGVRLYVDLYVLDDATTTATAGEPSPATLPERIFENPQMPQ